MNRHPQLFVFVLLLAGLPSLGACSRPTTTDTTETADSTVVETSVIENTMEETRKDIRKQIAEGNIKLSAEDKRLPRAEITPAGDLLIGGDKVRIDANQRALLLEYRKGIADIADAGAQIGMQGAALATKAMGEAFKSIFNGDSTGMEKRIEAEAEKIEVQARVLCERMPAMLATQQALADALPEFRPYATMDADDVDDCHDETIIVRE